MDRIRKKENKSNFHLANLFQVVGMDMMSQDRNKWQRYFIFNPAFLYSDRTILFHVKKWVNKKKENLT